MSTAAQYDDFISRQIIPLLLVPGQITQYGQRLMQQAPDPFIMVNRDPSANLNKDITRVIDIYQQLSKIPLGSISKSDKMRNIQLRLDLQAARQRLDMTMELMSNLNDRRREKLKQCRDRVDQVSIYLEAAQHWLVQNANTQLEGITRNMARWLEQYRASVTLCASDIDTTQMTLDAVRYFCTERLTLWESMLNAVDAGNRTIADAIRQEKQTWSR